MLNSDKVTFEIHEKINAKIELLYSYLRGAKIPFEAPDYQTLIVPKEYKKQTKDMLVSKYIEHDNERYHKENIYFEPKWGLNGTADELYKQALDGKFTDVGCYARISEILNQEAMYAKSRQVRIMRDREYEKNKHGDSYSINQIKLDILTKQPTEMLNIKYQKDVYLSIIQNPQKTNILVKLENKKDNSYASQLFPSDTFLGITRPMFDDVLTETIYYNMQPLDYLQELEELKNNELEMSEELSERI